MFLCRLQKLNPMEKLEKKNKHNFLKTLLKHNKMIPVYFEA